MTSITTAAAARTFTARLNSKIATTSKNLRELGDMVADAYANNIHNLMNYPTWDAYVAAEVHLEGLKPDTEGRQMLVGLFRQAGMTFEEIAKVVKATSRTLKTDAEKQGLTSKRATKPASKPASKPATPATSAGKVVTVKPTDEKVITGIKRLMDAMDATTLDEIIKYAQTVKAQRAPKTVKAQRAPKAA